MENFTKINMKIDTEKRVYDLDCSNEYKYHFCDGCLYFKIDEVDDEISFPLFGEIMGEIPCLFVNRIYFKMIDQLFYDKWVCDKKLVNPFTEGNNLDSLKLLTWKKNIYENNKDRCILVDTTPYLKCYKNVEKCKERCKEVYDNMNAYSKKIRDELKKIEGVFKKLVEIIPHIKDEYKNHVHDDITYELLVGKILGKNDIKGKRKQCFRITPKIKIDLKTKYFGNLDSSRGLLISNWEKCNNEQIKRNILYSLNKLEMYYIYLWVGYEFLEKCPSDSKMDNLMNLTVMDPVDQFLEAKDNMIKISNRYRMGILRILEDGSYKYYHTTHEIYKNCETSKDEQSWTVIFDEKHEDIEPCTSNDLERLNKRKLDIENIIKNLSLE